MSRSVIVPDDVYEKAARMAAERQVPVEDFISGALVDQMAAREYISRRAARSSHEAFLKALDQVPDVEPDGYDRL